MSLRGSRPVIHTMAGGFCSVCGETAEWLVQHDGVMVDAAEG
jgi:hypothetical protein